MFTNDFADIPGLNPQIPNAARVYDYTLGGAHNFEADRQAAEYMFSLIPSTRKWVRMLRAFLQEAATRLYQEGFTHFVDFASGLPTSDHIHEVVPGAKVIYSDKDPLTIAQAKVLLTNHPNVLYLESDVRNASALLESAQVQEFLKGNRKVAFGLNGITVFLSPEEIRQVFRDLYDWAAPGSKLFITYETKDPDRTTPQWEQFVGMFRQMGEPFWLYSREEALEMSRPWTPDATGLVPVSDFLGLPADYVAPADREGIGIEFYAAILEKK